MQSELPFYLLLTFCLILLIKQALVRNKKDVHYLFALLCISLCMVATKELSASTLGPYQYLIGLATCATCNVCWLISRSLFREKNAIDRRHITLAVVIALLIILNQAWYLASATGAHQWLSETVMLRLKTGLNEITTLLSSTILALTFWEALRNFGIKNKQQKQQRLLFACAFFVAVFNSMILSKLLFSPEELTAYSPWVLTTSALVIVFTIQAIIYLQSQPMHQVCQPTTCNDLALKDTLNDEISRTEKTTEKVAEEHNDKVDPSIVEGINALMKNQQLFLQSNLKVSDVAQALSQPEYKVSKAIRSHFKASNFNLFINQYRVEYAKQLLTSQEANKWNILVVGLESGFSSLPTFNRAFKALAGDMPSEYRKKSAQQV